MKRTTLTFIFTLLGFLVFGQSSFKSLSLDFKPSECIDEVEVYRLNERIVSQKFLNNEWHIEIAVKANCCGGRKGLARLSGDSLFLSALVIPEYDIGENGDTLRSYFLECDCDCCFQYNYVIRGVEQKELKVFYNDKLLSLSQEVYQKPEVGLESETVLIQEIDFDSRQETTYSNNLINEPALFGNASNEQGNREELKQFIAKRITFRNLKEKETVYVGFVIDTLGKVKDVKVIRGVDNKLLEDEAINIIKQLPNWKVGKMNNTPVKINYIVPVVFR